MANFASKTPHWIPLFQTVATWSLIPKILFSWLKHNVQSDAVEKAGKNWFGEEVSNEAKTHEPADKAGDRRHNSHRSRQLRVARISGRCQWRKSGRKHCTGG